VASHSLASRPGSLANGLTSRSLSLTTNAPSRRCAHRSSRTIDASYPADQRLKRLTRDLAAQSPRFVELWESGTPAPQQDFGRHKVIDHPAVGRITLDYDTLIVAADDLRIMIYTAEPETEDAERLALAIVLGTQALVD
jgi:hypothetical protein